MSREFRRGKKMRKIVGVFPPGRKPVLDLQRIRIEGARFPEERGIPLAVCPSPAPRKDFPGARFPGRSPLSAPDQPTEGLRADAPLPRSLSSIHQEGARDRMSA